MTEALPDPPGDLTTDVLAELGASFMGAKFLCVAADLDLFAKLADGPLTLDELSAAAQLPPSGVRVLANGLAALKVLELRDGRYANGPAAQAFLAGRTSVDVRAGLRLYNHLIYPMWMQLEHTIRTGEPARHQAPSEKFAKIFSEGVAAWTGVGARALPRVYDFSSHRRLIDIGGGTGSYLIPILERHEQMEATLYDLPPTVAIARGKLEGHAVRDRITLEEGDILFDPVPGGHDVVLMGGFIHLFDPPRVKIILQRAREAVASGTRLLIVDQWMDPTHTQPTFGALLSGTYLLLGGEARTYSPEEAEPWLREAGWRLLEHKHLGGATSLVVAEAVVP